MIIEGKYNKAEVFVNTIDNATKDQITRFLNNPVFKDNQISIMSDTHAGFGAVIGFTMKMGENIIPNIVGTDIGCGILCANLGKQNNIDLKKLDVFIRNKVPHGTTQYTTEQFFSDKENDVLDKVKEMLYNNNFSKHRNSEDNYNYVRMSLGTLGSGNHFIELNKDDNDNTYLVIHTGSRNLGNQVAEFYQQKAKKLVKKFIIDSDEYEKTYKYLEFLPMDMGGEDYLRDMLVAQEYASANRKRILLKILSHLEINSFTQIESTHNYISKKDNMIRKGAISAYSNETVIIPLNMRDGSIIAKGKSNPQWNYSAPHGAGRILSRTSALEQITLESFEKSMEGIYTTSVNNKTIDESPFAYKPMDLIINSIGETVDIINRIKPIYNFKAN